MGTFTLSDRSGANWSHAWSSVLSTDVFGSYTKDRFQEAPRTDETTVLGLRANYKFRRWPTLGAEYQHTNRDSNQSIYNYDGDIYFITAGMTM